MSDDTKDEQVQEEVTKIEGKPSHSTYEQLRNLNEYTLNGVRFVRRSNLGPLTIHATGSQEDGS